MSTEKNPIWLSQRAIPVVWSHAYKFIHWLGSWVHPWRWTWVICRVHINQNRGHLDSRYISIYINVHIKQPFNKGLKFQAVFSGIKFPVQPSNSTKDPMAKLFARQGRIASTTVPAILLVISSEDGAHRNLDDTARNRLWALRANKKTVNTMLICITWSVSLYTKGIWYVDHIYLSLCIWRIQTP